MSLKKISKIVNFDSKTSILEIDGYGVVEILECPGDIFANSICLGIGDGQLLRFASRILDNEDIPRSFLFFEKNSEYTVTVKWECLVRAILRTIGVRRNCEALEYNPNYKERAESFGWSVFSDNGVEKLSVQIAFLHENDMIEESGLVLSHKETVKSYKSSENEKERVSNGPVDNFVHLHVHSQYSLLDGVPHPDEIVERIAEMGQPAVALTDHGYMHGLYKFQQACNDHGIKPIHGFEAYLVEDMTIRERGLTYHIVLLAMNEVGWKNLIVLNTTAGRDGFYYRPRMDWNLLSKHSDGIIALSACYKSPVSFHFSVEGRDLDRARGNMRTLKSIFGDRYYNEVQQTGWDEYDNLVPEIIQLGIEENVKTVVTNDAHYARNGDHEVQDTMTKITSGGGLEFSGKGFYLKTREEMIQGPITPEMADVSLEIADRIDFQIGFDGYRFPAFDISEAGDYQEFLKDIKSKERT